MTTAAPEATHEWPKVTSGLPSLDEIQREFAEVGYYAQREDCVAIKDLVYVKAESGVPALYCTGIPGVGKTYLAESMPKTRSMGDMQYLFMQANAWDSTEQYFRGINTAAAVKGDYEAVDAPGILVKACVYSETSRVLICIDELDKTEDRAQNLLLDFLQYGRAQWEPGQFIQGKLSNMFFIGTSNETKPLSPALMRRFRYHRMQPLPLKLQVAIIAKKLGFPKSLVFGVINAAHELAKKSRREMSLQELQNLCKEIVFVSECSHDVQAMLMAWVAKSPKYEVETKQAGETLNDMLARYKKGEVPTEWVNAA